MALVEAALNPAVDAVTGLAAYMSLHSGNPGSNGANELSGGSPAYARQQLSWAAADDGEAAITGTETFNVPAGSTVAYIGLWTAVTGGTFLGADELASSETYTGQGVYEVTAATLTAT
ncbi:phage tail fiber protein [Plantactinospora sp. WMMB782]|uniref:phage tail fiber protein n=1 Tax=Plantactinospora sp. WMMB782 TaxID=3404121 RepID=UPI003B9273CF